MSTFPLVSRLVHMTPITKHRKRIRGILVTTTLAVALVSHGAPAATARPDPGPAEDPTPADAYCSVERIGRQIVHCDNLSGDGVPAPLWLPQRLPRGG
jgi:hypothetical protein